MKNNIKAEKIKVSTVNEKTEDVVLKEIPTEEAQLDKPITFGLLMMYGLPTMIAMVIMNGFSIVDGVFSMRALGVNALATISLLGPFFILSMGIGILFATGGAAVIVKKIGMGHFEEARENFTFMCIVAFIVTITVTIISFLFPEWIAELLGATDEIIYYTANYLRIAIWTIPLFAIGQVFNQFLIADGKPMIGMGITLLSSILGVVVSAIILFGFELGLIELAWGGLVSGVVPLFIYLYLFTKKGNKNGNIYFVKPKVDMSALGEIIYNGMAVFIPMASTVLLMTVKNNVVGRMDGIGAMGIAIVGMVMAIHGAFVVVFSGYMQGIGGLISFNYGKGNHDRQKQLFRLNLKIIPVISLVTYLIVLVLSYQLLRIYVPAGTEIHQLAVRGLRIISLSFLAIGINTFVAGHFTSLSKGWIATILGLIRTVVLDFGFVLILPVLFELDGVWMTMPIAEGIAIFLSLGLLFKFGKKYHYR